MGRSGKVVIGTVTARAWLYQLNGDGTWTVTYRAMGRQPVIEQALAQDYGPEWYGPEMGRPGSAVLYDIARRFSGTVWMPSIPEEPEGTVF